MDEAIAMQPLISLLPLLQLDRKLDLFACCQEIDPPNLTQIQTQRVVDPGLAAQNTLQFLAINQFNLFIKDIGRRVFQNIDFLSHAANEEFIDHSNVIFRARNVTQDEIEREDTRLPRKINKVIEYVRQCRTDLLSRGISAVEIVFSL